LAIAAAASGHQIVGVVPGPSGFVPVGVGRALGPHEPIECDLCIISTPDAVIEAVADALRTRMAGVRHACHLSGFTSVEVLSDLRDEGIGVGSFHPVQTLADSAASAQTLRGAHAAVTGDESTAHLLHGFAESLGMIAFDLADDLKPIHHAAATAAANFVTAALGVSAGLGASSGIPLDVYGPLARQAVENALEFGPERALTGPVSRGDLATVSGQLDVAAGVSEPVGRAFASMVAATAEMTPHRAEVQALLEARG
jgi:predicted short-subunit dehydrogenase-like oxidoreductase (DUF2520 family)